MNWRRFYPLSGLPGQSQLWAWISYDVANQSFTLLINTLLFSIFFTTIVVQGDQSLANFWWSLTFATSMVLTTLASPLAGAISDERAWKKESLVLTGLICGVLTCALGLVQPGQIWLAMLIYIPANFAFAIGENFLASFMPELSERKHFGKVSGFSWACAYAAALLLLVLTAGAMHLFKLESPDAWRPFFVFAGLWFIAFMIPTIFVLRERARPRPSGRSVWAAGFVRLGETIRHLRGFKDLALLILASLLYGTGMSVVVFFAGIIASDFGFRDVQLVMFVGVITATGVLGTLVPTILQDRLGHKRTVVMLLIVWTLTTLGLAFFAWLRARAPDPSSLPRWPIWLAGNLLGLGLGSLGSANRAFVGFLTPRSRSGEVFGIWGMVFKLAAVLTIPFAIVKDLMGTPQALVVLAFFIAAGLAVTLLIDVDRGVKAANDYDASFSDGAANTLTPCPPHTNLPPDAPHVPHNPHTPHGPPPGQEPR
ncbi:MAG: MFS transporter [Phycisphaeraceae bacterium]|nr:MFS transporter [Phycisphaeraceae bacterium]